MSTILIVDDHKEWAEPLSKLPAMRQHAVEIRANGREAFAALETLKPDLIVLDLMMPLLDGLSFLELLRRRPEWRDLRVVVFTGYPDAFAPERLAAFGVTEVFAKGSDDHGRLVKLIESTALSS